LTVRSPKQTIYSVRDGETLDTKEPPKEPLVSVKPRAATRRVGGRTIARAIMWSLPIVAVVVAGAIWVSSGRYVSTDNAYVKGERALIATELSGLIVEVAVAENERVSRGQMLFKLDETPYRLALAKIEAELETQRAEIRGLRAQWRSKREEIKSARSQLTYAEADFERQNDLAARRVASVQKLDESRRDLEIARQRIATAEEDLQRIEASLAGDPKIRVDDHPRVKQTAAARDEALLKLRQTTIEAPLTGIVSKKPVVGNYATAGATVMAVVADSDLWIEANFKETELTRVRAGQTATIAVDTYPDARCTGSVASIAQATGAEFAVLPPQNATGNWVKVVQRIPVRISVTCPPGAPPLRMGMSTTVEIDTGHSRSIGDLFAGLGKTLGLASASTSSKP
jgi:membrane fusion protein (multidrug efflux system)